MKKLLFTLIAAAIASFGAAAQISAGAGYANQITNTSIGDIDADNSSNGFYVGAGFSCPIIAGLSVDPGVYYSYMVSKQSLLDTELVTGNTQSHYLTIPINFRYTLKAVDFLDVFAYAGPTTTASMLGMTVDVDNFGEDGSPAGSTSASAPVWASTCFSLSASAQATTGGCSTSARATMSRPPTPDGI